VHSFVNNN